MIRKVIILNANFDMKDHERRTSKLNLRGQNGLHLCVFYFEINILDYMTSIKYGLQHGKRTGFVWAWFFSRVFHTGIFLSLYGQKVCTLIRVFEIVTVIIKVISCWRLIE